MTIGSGLFTNKGPAQAHHVRPGGKRGEIGDLRNDLLETFSSVAALTVQEFVDPLAASAANIMAATASQVTEDVLLPGTAATGVLDEDTLANLSTGGPRQLEFTVAGTTPAHRAPTATIRGNDQRGRYVEEVLALPDVADDVLTATFWSYVRSVTLAPGSGVGASVAIGLGALLGLRAPVVSRAGRVAVLQEVSGGSVVTNGTVAVATETAARVVGTGDVTAAATLTALADTNFLVTVDGGAPVTVTFAAVVANAAAVITAINTAVGATVAALDATGSDNVVLTSPTKGSDSSIKVAAGATSALTALGLTAGYYQGSEGGDGTYAPNSAPNGSTSYALYYEYAGASL